MIEIIPNWHPVFVHFTVALWMLSVGLFILVPFLKSPLSDQWKTVACWSLWFGAGFTVLTVATGFYAYNTVDHDTPSHLAMTEHRNWAIITASVFLFLTIWSIILVRKRKEIGRFFMVVTLIGGGLLMSTGWHGAEAVFRYGLGVTSLPKVEGEGHSHSHGNGQQHAEEEGIQSGVSHGAVEVEQMDFSGMDKGFGDDHDH